MNRRVLVTRPETAAAATAERLAELQFEPVRLPLTEIVPVTHQDLLPAGTYAAVLVTSANAVRHAAPAVLSACAGLPLFAVGTRTADAAADAGFAEVRTAASGEAVGLAGLVAGSVAPGSNLIYLTGRIRKPTLEALLTEAGFAVAAVETYDAPAIEWRTEAVERILGTQSLGWAMAHSPRAAAFLGGIAERVPGPFRGTRYVVISADAAAPLQPICGPRVIVAGRPTEESMLSVLQRAR